jgi:hypothetical protein
VDIIFHYPPELMALLIERSPPLPRKTLLFKGQVSASHKTSRLSSANSAAVRKHEIVRTVLTRLNERGEKSLGERREILKRVTEFEDYSTCWPADQLKAKGLVAEIRRVVNVKDSFTRMSQERDSESRNDGKRRKPRDPSEESGV